MEFNIHETEYWRIALSNEQYYFGRCVVILKRECEELSGLTEDEVLDLLRIIKKFEKGMKKEFKVDMFNWTCLMNNAYKETNDEKPQVHFHVRPRHKNKVGFAGVSFEDKKFAHHYKNKAKKEVSEEIMEKIAERIREMMR